MLTTCDQMPALYRSVYKLCITTIITHYVLDLHLYSPSNELLIFYSSSHFSTVYLALACATSAVAKYIRTFKFFFICTTIGHFAVYVFCLQFALIQFFDIFPKITDFWLNHLLEQSYKRQQSHGLKGVEYVV